MTQGRVSLGTAWSDADIQQLYDLRQDKKSWGQIGLIIQRSGGAAQQQWMRVSRRQLPKEVTLLLMHDKMQRENHSVSVQTFYIVSRWDNKIDLHR